MRQTRAWYWKGNAGYVLPPDTRMSQERQMILDYFRSQFQGDGRYNDGYMGDCGVFQQK